MLTLERLGEMKGRGPRLFTPNLAFDPAPGKLTDPDFKESGGRFVRGFGPRRHTFT